jgi:hypothetical protein
LPYSDPDGLYTRKPDGCSRGTKLLIDVIYTVAYHWQPLYPSLSPISVLDLNEGSCSTINHATHDDGTHVDIIAGCATSVSCADKQPKIVLAKLVRGHGRGVRHFEQRRGGPPGSERLLRAAGGLYSLEVAVHAERYERYRSRFPLPRPGQEAGRHVQLMSDLGFAPILASLAWTALATALLAGGCSSAENGAAARTPGEDAGHAGGDGDGGIEPPADSGPQPVDSGPEPADGSTTDADAGPRVAQYDPRATGQTWTAPTLGGTCGARTINENFSSGNYNVHHYLLSLPPAVDVVVTATRTAGTWSPAVILHDDRGVTVFDGVLAGSTSNLSVEETAGSAAESLELRVNAPLGMHVSAFVTDWDVVDSDFSAALSTDARYSIEVSPECAPLGPLTVNGVQLDWRQERWIRTIARAVVPEMLGTAGERLDKASYVAWWALKEGVLNVNNPLSYSNCSFPPDKHIGPLEICPNENNAWQVGISGVQSAWRSVESVETLAVSVHPEKSITDVLADAARLAGFGAATTTGQSIAASTDRLRMSWLLRDGAVGFEAQYRPVYDQCFVRQESWCFGTGWSSTASFAPDRAGAEQSVADLRSIFEALAP